MIWRTRAAILLPGPGNETNTPHRWPTEPDVLPGVTSGALNAQIGTASTAHASFCLQAEYLMRK